MPVIGTPPLGRTGGSGPTAAAACEAYATAFCQKRDQCQDMAATRAFGTLDACVSREVLRCTAALAAPGTGATPETTETCASALPAAECSVWLSSKPTVCPIQNGTRDTGASCVFNAQCVTGYCASPEHAACGACAALPVEGDDCTSTGACGPSALKCDATSNKCIAVVATGAVCDATHACGSGLVCVGDDPMTNTAGLCQPEATTVGAVCDPKHSTGVSCDHNVGVTCDKTSKLCVAITDAGLGATCGLDKMTSAFAECTGGTTCETIKNGNMTTSTCVNAAADNAACDTEAGPPCLGPARCVVAAGSTTAGTCLIADASTCH